jgi:DNA polymerase-3 subunit alpha
VEGALKNGVEERVANKVFDLVANFAGYGFNKAHSTAYAMIAYWTAYLKANYLREFLAALLSSEMGNTDKLVTYINECEGLGVKVLPPDVNESQGRFEVVEGGIRFGSVAVKNVGAPAISSIVDARNEKGRFTSLHDFCERVDLRLVNKRVIESLIKCGAFDCFGAARSQLFAVADDAIAVGQRLQKDRLSGQFSLFGTGSDFREYPDVPEWHEGKLLSFEKDVLGFYISGHPLARYEKLIKTYSTVSTGGLHELEDGADVGIAGIVTRLRRIATKKGNRMAYVQLEDMEGSIEVIFFPRCLEEYATLLKQDALIYVKGRIDLRQDVPKVVVKEVIPLNEAERHLAKSAHIKLITAGLEEKALLSLKKVLLSYPGNCSVYFHLKGSLSRRIILGGNSELTVEPGTELMKKVEELAGEGNISFKP